MGMQCHFSLNDLPETVGVSRFYDKESQTISWTLTNGYTVSGTDSPNVWFDVGSMSQAALDMIEWLIRNRICFQCS